MYKLVVSSIFLVSLIITGCGGDRTEIDRDKKVISIKSISLDNNIVVTTDNFTTLSVVAEVDSDIYIDDKYIGRTSDDGSLDITFDRLKEGNNSYSIYSVSNGKRSNVIEINIIKKDKSASMGKISTAGKANNLTTSKKGVVFVAEKSSGVEVLSVGFNDRVDSLLLSTIRSIDAQNVILSEDETELYIEDAQKKYHVMDISDINNPTEIDIVDKIDISTSVISEDYHNRFRICSKGLISEDISEANNVVKNFIIEDKDIKDVVLVDNDTKLLVAHAKEGLELISLVDKKNPVVIAKKSLDASVSALSLLKDKEVLFVAKAEAGIEIFNLHILLAQMMEK